MGYFTVLHVVPLDEVAAQVCLADLLHVPHADVEEVVPEQPHGGAHALPFQQHAVGREGWRGHVIPHQSPEFLPNKKGIMVNGEHKDVEAESEGTGWCQTPKVQRKAVEVGREMVCSHP